ncbi:nicotinate (nicotinamide) nucleotide adenylyltransferase [soil metagenome]
MNIGLYFGSFNPVHTGHLIIGNTIASESELHQVWFIISPQNPLKPQKTLLNEYHRKHLIDISIEGESKLRSSSIEFNLPKPSFTIDTLSYLHEKHPSYTFSLIVGSDSYSNLHNWKNFDQLENYPILIYKRPGFEITLRKINHRIINAPLLEISSTDIRKMIKEKKSIRYFVPDVVKNEIERNGYYK